MDALSKFLVKELAYVREVVKVLKEGIENEGVDNIEEVLANLDNTVEYLDGVIEDATTDNIKTDAEEPVCFFVPWK